MAFASGQTVTAAMLNRITPNVLEVSLSGDFTVTTSELDLTGLSVSVTTPQANTKIEITASLDWGASGTSDFSVVRCYVNGVAQSDEMNRGSSGARLPASKTWEVTVASASTFTVKLTGQKLISGNTTTIYGTHSTLKVSGNGIS